MGCNSDDGVIPNKKESTQHLSMAGPSTLHGAQTILDPSKIKPMYVLCAFKHHLNHIWSNNFPNIEIIIQHLPMVPNKCNLLLNHGFWCSIFGGKGYQGTQLKKSSVGWIPMEDPPRITYFAHQPLVWSWSIDMVNSMDPSHQVHDANEVCWICLSTKSPGRWWYMNIYDIPLEWSTFGTCVVFSCNNDLTGSQKTQKAQKTQKPQSTSPRTKTFGTSTTGAAKCGHAWGILSARRGQRGRSMDPKWWPF